MDKRSAPKRRIRHVLTAALAAAVVYLSTPRPAMTETAGPPLPRASSTTTCTSDELFLLQHGFGGGTMWDVDLAAIAAGGTAANPRQFCPGGLTFDQFAVDRLPDGRYFGTVLEDCFGAAAWGELLPDAYAVGSTAPGVIVHEPLPYRVPKLAPAFVAAEPEPGSPVGYRFDLRARDASCTRIVADGPGGQACALDLYAVDSIEPYSEHLVAGDLWPHSFRMNFGLGTAVSHDGSNAFWVTRDAIHCYGPGPLCPGTVAAAAVEQIGFLRFLDLRNDTFLVGSTRPGFLHLVNGNVVWEYDFATGDPMPIAIPFVAGRGGSYRGCPSGRVIVGATAALETSETGKTASFTLVLSDPPAADVVVAMSGVDATEGTLSPESVTFTTGDWSVPKIVMVGGVDDGVADGPQTWFLEIDSSSIDPLFDGKHVTSLPVTNVENVAPTVTSVTDVILQTGSRANVAVATIDDFDDPVASLVVSGSISAADTTADTFVNTGGTVTANFELGCTSMGGSWSIGVTDPHGNSTSGGALIFWQADTPPDVSFPRDMFITAGRSSLLVPDVLRDNGSIASVGILAASSYPFTFTFDPLTEELYAVVDPSPPDSSYVVQWVVTDNCGLQTLPPVGTLLRVQQPPAIAAGSATIRQGDAPATVALATVSDPEDTAGFIAVTASSIPSGIILGSIQNTDGAVTASLAADCTASPGMHAIGLRAADSSGGTTDTTFAVTVTADPTPTLGTYADAALNAGNGTTVAPSAAPADDLAVTGVTVDAPGFAGSISVDAVTGVVTITNATPPGVHTVTITANDRCSAIARSFALSVNGPPSITGGTATLRQGGTTTATLATVSDAETAAGSLPVVATSVPSGLTLGTISNTAGTIMAPLTAGCSLAPGPYAIALEVTDAGGLMDTAATGVTVTANAAPVLGTYAATRVASGGGTTVSPSVSPTDDGTIASLDLAAPGFTGSVTVDAAGAITIANAGPAGTHSITVTATDDCGLTSTSTLTLSVDAPPSITPVSPLTRTQGDPATTATLATVADAEDSAGSLTVVATSSPAGVVLGPLTNSGGTITGSLAASCSSTTGAQTITLEVTDSRGQTASANLTVNVTANPAPVLGTYAATTLSSNAGTTVSPSAAPSDNGTVASVAVSAPGFGGTVSVDAAGAVTIANATPAGAHTITVTATDDCGSTSTATLALTVDAVPSIVAAAPIARTQGSPPAVITLATVTDAEDAAGSLAVTANSVPAGVVLGPLTNTSGTITASVAATCFATTGASTILLEVADSRGQTATANLTVTVAVNPAPLLGTYAATTLTSGAGAMVTPSVSPSDNGTIESLTVASPGFTGTLGVDAAGAITIANAGPAGAHTITVTATDDCSATSTATLSLTVDGPPAIAAAPPIARTQGSAASVVTLATVSDAEDTAGSLAVVATSVPSGLTLGPLTNTGGTITASLAASCAAATAAQTIALEVTDSRGQTASTNVTVDVAANPPPILGTYAPTTLSLAGATTVAPSAAPADNGTVGSVALAAPGFTGSVSVDAAGVITIANAGPAGSHTITVTATDDCAATSTATLALSVDGPPAIAAAGPIERTQASPAAVATLATVSDGEDAYGSLTVVATSIPSGLTLGPLTNTAGTITGSLAASCSAATGTQSITLEVSDSRGQTASTSAAVDVASNPAPVLGTYSATTVGLAGSTVVSPTPAPVDNGSVSSVTVAAPGFTGSAAVNAAGEITIANAGPAGTHTITVTATDDCGATSTSNLTLTVDVPPSIAAAAPIALTQASPARTITLATVSDTEDAAASLAVTATSVPAGLTLGPLTNSDGTITASISASCTAASGAITLEVTDSSGQTAAASVTVNVTPNPAPVLGTYSPTTLSSGTGTIVSPTAAPSDNGSIASLTVAAPGFGGTISVDPAGAITIANASPSGAHTITVTATDDCGAISTSTLSLSVDGGPSIVAAAPVALTQASPGSVFTLANVSDAEDASGSLSVVATSVPTGLTLGPLTNSGGTITASISASCAATSGTITLEVTDSRGQTASSSVAVNVTPNPAPVLGTYAATTLSSGTGTVVAPSAAPSDNGTITSLTVAAPGFGGTVSVDAAGAITIANASPAGTHTITVTATDDCTATSSSTLSLSVDGGPSIVAAAPIAVTQASPASIVTLANVSDGEDGAGSLSVIATSVPAGITLGPLTNSGGLIMASVAANCAAASGAIALEVTDSRGQTASSSVTVNITANTAPLLGTYAATTLSSGAGAIVSPSAAPSDNGSISSLTVAAPGFGGTVGVDAAGAITIANASPAGIHAITVTATDDCGATSTSTLSLSVDGGPSIVAAAPLAVTQASPASTVTLATVSDGEDAPGSLLVVATSVPAGVTLGPLTNSGGTITASISASCTAVSGAVTLEVTDGRGQTAFASVTVNVTPNPAPVLGTYAAATLSSGTGTVIAPSAAPSDNGTIASLTVAASGFAGTVSVDAAGAITIANASPAGTHTITVTATDDCTATSTSTLTLNVDGGPSIVASPAIALTQASPAATLTLATVSDSEDAAGSLLVSATSVPAGITLGPLTNSGGAITASISASCAAANGAIALEVTDSRGQTASSSVTVNVTPNPAPVLGTYAATTLSNGAGTIVSPSAAPSDNGTIASLTVAAPGFPGTVSVDAAGAITIANAGPADTHTITVTATDDCGATSTSTLTLNVDGGPSIVASPAIALTQASPAATLTLATVSDSEDAAGSLLVSATSVPAGITLGPLTNSGGTITASISASCTAASGAIALEVTDSRGQTASASVTVNVTPNPSPILGNYAAATLSSGTGTVVAPSAAPSDNGTIASLTVAAPGFGGTVSVDPAGAITIANAGPAGMHTITVTATDDCGATSSSTLSLSVDGGPSIVGGAPIAVTQASPASVFTLATVTDGEDAPGSLLASATSVPAGITLGPLTNSGGTITASISASCTAASGAVALEVADSRGQTSTTSVTLNVAPNPAPILGVYAPAILPRGGVSTFVPSFPPSDNGSVATIAVSAPGFTGSISVDPAGVITIANAGPLGVHAITVTATDDCGATSSSSLALTVPAVTLSSISPGGACQNQPPLTLTLTGTGFEPGMRILWNGTPRAATYVDPTRIEASVASSDLTAASVVMIAIANTAGSPLTPALPFTIVTDATPPVVEAPPRANLVESLTGGIGSAGPHGATSTSSEGLRAFLGGADASDFCSPVTALGARLADGSAVRTDTIFPAGPTTVRFTFSDASGNEGVGESTVTIWRYGSLLVPDRDPGVDELLLLANVVDGKLALESDRFPAPRAAADLNRDGAVSALDIGLFHDYIDAASSPVSGSRRRPIQRPGAIEPLVHRLVIDSPGTALGAFIARVEFDPSRVEVLGTEEGAATEFGGKMQATEPALANLSGMLVVAGAQTSTDSPRGSVEVARVSFREIVPGGIASVTVDLDVAPAFPPD